MEKLETTRTIPTTTKLRMAGYVVTIVVHTINGLVMESGFYGGALSDPGVRRYYEFRTRFITCWTFVAQIIYSAMGLYCDVKSCQGKKDTKTVKDFREFLDMAFPGLIVPYSFMVATLFWSLYVYDKNLILPAFMKKVVSTFSNHLVHTAIIPVVIWEMAFNPRSRRRCHSRNIVFMTVFTTIYVAVLIISYYEKGMWPYPVLTYLQDTIYFNIFVGGTIALLPFFYCMQCTMPSLIQLRILGHTAALIMHAVNSAVMLKQMMGDIVKKDKEVRTMVSLQGHYFTVWNIVFQILYSSLALACDLLVVMKKEDILPKFVYKFRHKFFETIVFPGSVFIFLLFWPIYLYDRNLVFPEFIDKIFSQKSNLVMHLGILPVVLWELVFQPRTTPKSHSENIKIITTLFIIYNSVIFYTYAQRGLWPYPIMYKIYGTIYFPILYIYIFLLGILAYYLQWPLSSYLWESKKINEKVQ